MLYKVANPIMEDILYLGSVDEEAKNEALSGLIAL